LPGPLDDFLEHPPTTPAADALRQALLRRTTAVLRRRRLRRRLALVGAIAAVMLLAAVATWLSLPRSDAPQVADQQRVPSIPDKAAVAHASPADRGMPPAT